MNLEKAIIFCTPSYRYLEERVFDENLFEHGDLEVKYFPDGERYQRVITDVENRDVVIISGTISDEEVLTLYD